HKERGFIMKTKQLLSLISLFLISITFVAQANQVKQLDIISSEQVYKIQEPINVTVTNNTTDKTLSYYVIRAEWFDSDVWKQVRSDTGCPCMAECKKGPAYIKPGITTTIHWDQKDDKCLQVQPGTYRLNVSFVEKQPSVKDFKQPSTTFVIKQ
ncbi:hypothetical protein KJ708_11490, partial [bacterium]|nr:hypothetical protein [bacterium]